MSTETVDVPTPDGSADAFLAQPDDTSTEYPPVLFVMDAFGLRPQIETMAERIAAQGYVVLAPNWFYRDVKGRVLDKMPDPEDPDARQRAIGVVMPLVQSITADVAARDGKAFIDYLQTVEGARPGPVAITGYCMGGRIGWRIAAAYPGAVDALGSFHGGGFVTEADDSPHLSADDIDAELYFGHADNDNSMNAEAIATLDQSLDAVGAVYRSELYEGAAHGYTMADTASYNEAAAERHFVELFALLERAM